MRLTSDEIKMICAKHNVDMLWSFSRFDSYKNSSFEWFLKYIKKEEPKGETSPYGILGGVAHDIIDKWYAGEIADEDMVDEFQTEYVANVEMLGLKFDRSDEEKNKKLKQKYYENLEHYFKNAKKLPYNLITEKPVIIQVTDGIVFQGYIDAIYKDENGIYHIIDFKTSSKYTGKALVDHSYQLVLYAEGLRQMGIPANEITVSFEFLKYVTVRSEQVNDKIAESVIERRDLGFKLQAKAKVWLKRLGYENQAEELLNEMLISNGIECLPDDVKEKFEISDCYVEVENWQDIWSGLKEEIIETVNEIEAKKKQYEETGDETIWYGTDEELESASYYLNNLSDYSYNQLTDYKLYCERKAAEKELGNDLLGINSENNDELSWLNDL